MQVIIPLAGKGTRLRPHTHRVPKPMLKVAGRPVMDWVMDRLDGLGVTELIFITGHLKEQVEAWLADCGLTLEVTGGARGYLASLKGLPGAQVRLLSASDIADARATSRTLGSGADGSSWPA